MKYDVYFIVNLNLVLRIFLTYFVDLELDQYHFLIDFYSVPF